MPHLLFYIISLLVLLIVIIIYIYKRFKTDKTVNYRRDYYIKTEPMIDLGDSAELIIKDEGLPQDQQFNISTQDFSSDVAEENEAIYVTEQGPSFDVTEDSLGFKDNVVSETQLSGSMIDSLIPENLHIATTAICHSCEDRNSENHISKHDQYRPESSIYDPNLIVLQVIAPPENPYMGYELLQTLLSLGMRFGEMGVFHRHKDESDKSKILFSVAAATSDGRFPIDEIGSFKCNGLIVFMNLDAKQKLMGRFDLMLDLSRQLVEELGGEIYDDLNQAINTNTLRRLREKICAIETNNLYAADLLDGID